MQSNVTWRVHCVIQFAYTFSIIQVKTFMQYSPLSNQIPPIPQWVVLGGTEGKCFSPVDEREKLKLKSKRLGGCHSADPSLYLFWLPAVANVPRVYDEQTPAHSGSKWPNLQIGPILDKKNSKVQYFFLWLDTGNPKIVPESSISLVFKTIFKHCFLSGFLVTPVRFSSPFLENLTVGTRKLDRNMFWRWF